MLEPRTSYHACMGYDVAKKENNEPSRLLTKTKKGQQRLACFSAESFCDWRGSHSAFHAEPIKKNPKGTWPIRNPFKGNPDPPAWFLEAH